MYRRLRDLREDADLTQRELAEYLNCTQVSYSHYELGPYAIGEVSLRLRYEEIADLLGPGGLDRLGVRLEPES